MKAPALDINIQTAKQYGNIKIDLRKKDTPIPENSIGIAVITI